VFHFYGTRLCNAVFTKSHTWTRLVPFTLLYLTSLMTDLIPTFMEPRIVNVFYQNQQDATLHNGICYYKCSPCFRRFLLPSPGSQSCKHSIGVFVQFFLLLTAFVGGLKLVPNQLQPTHDSGKKQKKVDIYPILCVQF
jgi:hypothetical protein